MNFCKILLALTMTAGCLFLSPLCAEQNAYGNDSVTIAKAESKKATPKKAKDKKSTSGKTKTVGKKGLKANAKPKAKEKGLKAKAPPLKKIKSPKKIAAPAYSDRYGESRSSSLGTWLMVGFGVIVFGALCFLVWLEYRPTINASGVVYGPFEYLPAHLGGAFTAEFHEAPKNHRRHVDPQGQAGHTHPSPVTVTREPVIGADKTSGSKRVPPPSRAG